MVVTAAMMQPQALRGLKLAPPRCIPFGYISYDDGEREFFLNEPWDKVELS
jgi:hypothetical protein